MKDDEKTMYVNGTSGDDKESTVYIGKNQPGNAEPHKENEGNTVYIGNADANNASSVISDNNDSQVSSDAEIINETHVSQENMMTDRSVSEQEVNSDNALYYLPTNTMLQKRYRINSVLGEGGFGITYSGWDVTLNIPVAIKEYYPSGLVTRNATLGKTTQVVPVASAKYGTQFRDGIDRVLDEARRMAKFRNIQGIVGIYDFFEANNTAYIVMEYIEGVTLDKYCKNNRMDNTTLFNMLVPVMDALQALHNEGIIHRDISPDNIMVDNEGNFKLLDFGAARGYSEESSTTMSVILKKSYAPEEQFRTKGNQGPWTDVYALGATIYELITGQTPSTSIDRLAEDDIVDIKDCAPSLTKGQAEAIMTALAVRQKDRWQSMNEFKIALLQGVGSSAKTIQKKNDILSSTSDVAQKDENSKNNYVSLIINWIKQNKKKSGIVLACLILFACILAFVKGNNDGPGYFGVYSSDVPEDVKTEYNVGDGTYVTGVIANTPAAKSGFVAGDILLSLDDNILTGEKDFSSIITRYNAGDKVKIKYLHISKDGIYEEKNKTVKLANKNEQDEVNFTVSSVTTSSKTSSDSNYEDLTFEFVGFEPHGSSSKYADIYFKVNNPNSDTLSITPSGVYLNNVSVTNYSFDGITGKAESVLNKQVDYSDTNKKLIGDNITSFRIEYYISGEYGNYRTFEQKDFNYSISTGEFITNTNINEDSITENNTNISSEEVIDKNVDADITENEIKTESEPTEDEIAQIVDAYNFVVPDYLDVKYTSYENKYGYLTLFYNVTNNSDTAKYVNFRSYGYVMGIDVSCTTEGNKTISPGMTSSIGCKFDWSKIKSIGFEEIDNLILKLYVKNDKDDKNVLDEFNQCLKINDNTGNWEYCEFKDIDNTDNEKSGTKSITAGNRKIDIRYAGFYNKYGYITYNMWVTNNSDLPMYVSFDTYQNVNGVSIKHTTEGNKTIMPHTTSAVGCKFDWDNITNAGINEVNELEFLMYVKPDSDSKTKDEFTYKMAYDNSKESFVYVE